MLIVDVLRKNKGSKDKTTIKGKSVVTTSPKPPEKAGTYIAVETLISILKSLPENELALFEMNGKAIVALSNKAKI